MSDYDLYALERLESDEVHPPEYVNELINRNMPSIISILITSIFSPGTCPEDQANLIPPIGTDICSLYAINLVLLIFVLISVPAMLCTMPCLALSGGEKDSEASQIELADAENPGINDGDATEELMAKRREELRDLEK